MRWDDLFADLEAQADALAVSERAAEIGERTRIEVGAIGVVDRLRAAVGSPLRLQVEGGLGVDGVLARVGSDWALVEEGAGRECVVSLTALVSVAGLGRLSAVPGSGGAVAAQLTMRTALRGIAADRSTVRLHLRDTTTIDATLDRVGADFVEVARHAAGEARRRGDVRDVVLVPLSALVAVRRFAL